MKHLILTSTSKIKVDAVKEVFTSYEIIAIKTPTTVEQPFGVEQTKELSRGRIYYVEGLLSTKLPILSIESGIYESGGNYYDFVYVILKGESGYPWKYCDGGNLLIPKEYQHYVTEAQDKGFATTTFGAVLNSYNPSIPKDNWQESLCGISRKDQIKQILEKVTLKNED